MCPRRPHDADQDHGQPRPVPAVVPHVPAVPIAVLVLVLGQALGAQSDVTPATGRVHLKRGDIILLCSDGLSGKLRAEDIQNIVISNAGNLPTACDELIAEANHRGGEDNITVVLARFDGDDLQEATTDRITIELPALEEDKTLEDTFDADTQPH